MKYRSRGLDAFNNNINNPARILRQMGELMRSRIAQSFPNQARGNIQWPGRGVPNVMGAIEDLGKSSTIKERRFESRKALMDTGTLLRSFGRGEANTEITSKYKIEVGTPLPYAPVLNTGGESEKAVTRAVKENLARYLKRMRGKAKRSVSGLAKDKFSERAKSLGFLFRRDRVKVNIRPRPFAVVDEQDTRDFVRIINREILK